MMSSKHDQRGILGCLGFFLCCLLRSACWDSKKYNRLVSCMYWYVLESYKCWLIVTEWYAVYIVVIRCSSDICHSHISNYTQTQMYEIDFVIFTSHSTHCGVKIRKNCSESQFKAKFGLFVELIRILKCLHIIEIFIGFKSLSVTMEHKTEWNWWHGLGTSTMICHLFA